MAKISNLIIVLAFGIYSCTSNTEKVKSESQNSITKEESYKESKVDTAIKVKNQIRTSECVRGAAEPIIKSNVYSNSTFQLQQDSLTGIEKVRFDNGDSLIIKNWGCEYYVLTFRFVTGRFQESIDNVPFWYKKAVLLMNECKDGIDAPVNIEKGVEALISYIDNDQPENYRNLKLNNELDYGGDDMREYVTFEKIEKISKDKFALELSITIGPL